MTTTRIRGTSDRTKEKIIYVRLDWYETSGSIHGGSRRGAKNRNFTHTASECCGTPWKRCGTMDDCHARSRASRTYVRVRASNSQHVMTMKVADFLRIIIGRDIPCCARKDDISNVHVAFTCSSHQSYNPFIPTSRYELSGLLRVCTGPLLAGYPSCPRTYDNSRVLLRVSRERTSC